MNFLTELLIIDYTTVAIAAIASYALGFAWYHWAVFGEAWANALQLSKEEADNTEGLGIPFAVSLASGLTKAVLMALLLSAMNVNSFIGGALFGVVIAVAITMTSLGYYNGFARLSSKLTLINSGHSVAELALIGGVIGAMS